MKNTEKANTNYEIKEGFYSLSDGVCGFESMLTNYENELKSIGKLDELKKAFKIMETIKDSVYKEMYPTSSEIIIK